VDLRTEQLVALALRAMARDESLKAHIRNTSEAYRVLRRAASRYIGGETLEACVEMVRVVNANDVAASVDDMGENTGDADGATAATEEFERACKAIGANALRASVSLELDRDPSSGALSYRCYRHRVKTTKMRACASTACCVLVISTNCTRTNAGSDGHPNAQGSAMTVAQPPAISQTVAKVGQPAPDFALTDLDGHEVRLGAYHGRPVVLEWFNPGCPFVKASHTKGSLSGLAEKEIKKGVVWLAINSAAPGKQGYGKQANAEGKARFDLTHPILLDETGVVGKAYGANHTPHLIVIDANGVLVYRGAIDNAPDGEGEVPTGGSLINYAASALDDIANGRAVRVPETEAYGCSVKYASQ
jgi:peroxiredoxin